MEILRGIHSAITETDNVFRKMCDFKTNFRNQTNNEMENDMMGVISEYVKYW